MRLDTIRIIAGLCWVCTTSPTGLFAQKVNDYILTDSSKSTSLWVMGGNNRENSQFIRVWFSDKEEPEKYYPSDLVEYGLKDGRTYVVREISLPNGKKKVFLEKRTFKDLSLLIYHDEGGYQLFLEPDYEALIPLTPDKYQSELIKWTSGCPEMQEAIGRIKFSKKSINRLLLFYQRCKGGVFPQAYVGYSLGYSASWFGVPRRRNDIGLLAALPDFPFDFFAVENFRTHSSFSGGVFGEVPIGVSPFSMLGGVQLTQTSFSEARNILLTEISFQGNFITLELPITMRYTRLNRKWRPYGQVGMSYLRNFENSVQFTKTRVRSTTGQAEDLDSADLIAGNMYAFEAGVGLSRIVRGENRISVELKVKKAFGFSRALTLEFYTMGVAYSFPK